MSILIRLLNNFREIRIVRPIQKFPMQHQIFILQMARHGVGTISKGIADKRVVADSRRRVMPLQLFQHSIVAVKLCTAQSDLLTLAHLASVGMAADSPLDDLHRHDILDGFVQVLIMHFNQAPSAIDLISDLTDLSAMLIDHDLHNLLIASISGDSLPGLDEYALAGCANRATGR